MQGPSVAMHRMAVTWYGRVDIGLRRGTYRISPDALPVVPGREFAGTVAKLGDGGNPYRVGQRVVGYPSLGGYAEYAIAKVSEVRPVPDGVTSAHAAAMPTTFLTAWFGLTTDGALKSGEWLRSALENRDENVRTGRCREWTATGDHLVKHDA